jgi:hypothetical protein
MRGRVIGIIISIALALANISCGGSGSRFPADYKGIFTERLEVRAK